MSEINISNVNDFQSLAAQLQAELATRAAWAGNVETQVGKTLIDMIAAVGAFANSTSLRAFQEAFPETALNRRSLYASASGQGVRIPRKGPAHIQVTCAYVRPSNAAPAQVVIAPFTQFQAAGTYWFNRDAISVTAGTPATATLHQGYVVDQSIQGLSQDYQAFESVERDCAVSDQDVRVFINDVLVQVTDMGLWNFRNVAAVQDRTTAEGRLHLLFGNSTFGARPSSADIVRIQYAVTSGSDANSVNTVGAKVALVNSVSGLTFTATTQPAGGTDEMAASTLKLMAASNFGTFGAAVTPTQYKSLALSYPGVIDAKLYAQRELDPTDVRLMNHVQVSVLTATDWDATQKAEFIDFMQRRSMYSTIITWRPIVVAERSVTAKLFCYNWANLSECEASANTALAALFAPRAGSLGYAVTLSDIYSTLLNSNSGIEYVELLSPTQDFAATPEPMPAPSYVQGIIHAGFNLPPSATYTYGVSAVDAFGETQVTNFSSYALEADGNGMAMNWLRRPGITTYRVYGRTATNTGMVRLAELTVGQGNPEFWIDADRVFWFDDGSTPANPAQLPQAGAYPTIQNKLVSSTITSAYSTRNTLRK